MSTAGRKAKRHINMLARLRKKLSPEYIAFIESGEPPANWPKPKKS